MKTKRGKDKAMLSKNIKDMMMQEGPQSKNALATTALVGRRRTVKKRNMSLRKRNQYMKSQRVNQTRKEVSEYGV